MRDKFDYLSEKKKKSKFKRKLVAFFIAFDIFFAYVYVCAMNLIFEYAAKDFQYYVSNCSYYAVKDCLSEDIDFSSLCSVQKNDSGEIVFIKTDTFLLNYLSQKLALNCYEYLSKYTATGVNVPLGSFCGIRLLAGYGKKINVKLTCALSVECRILREFVSAGINQTRQVLSLVIHSEISIFSLFKSKYCDGDIEVVLCDSVIIGKVPEIYLQNEELARSSIGG